MTRVGVVTVARSDYGIYRPVLQELTRHEDIEPLLFVGGAHLLERFGRTVQEIERDGYPIAARVDVLVSDDSPYAVAESIGRGVTAFAAAFSTTRPDMIILLGDRYEMLAAGIAALPLAIPIAHIHGGESTAGAIDDAIRHTLTKLSHLHFASTPAYARRIVQMGEEPWRVTVSGAPALDALTGFAPLNEGELDRLGVHLRGPTLLVTYHPVTLLPNNTSDEVDACLGAVSDSGLDAVLTYPNADARHSEIVAAIEAFAASSDRYTLVKSLGSRAYFTVMARAAAMVGNSSSGIIEAASFRLPVVDIGIRQQGRVRGENVLHAEPNRAAIGEAINVAVSAGFRASLDGLTNPYGDGQAARRIVDILASTPLDVRLLVKRFHDLEG
jgi:UDP-hydrolysing UDP-N-acetyl-D-glucosamine 2-epimerase